MAIPPASETQTPPVAPPSASTPSPAPMMTAGSFYVRTPRQPSFSRSPNTFRMPVPMEHQPTFRFGHSCEVSDSNPVFQFRASSTPVENRNTGSGLVLGGVSGLNPVFQFRASSTRVENENTSSGLVVGGGSGSIFQFGATSTRVENGNTNSEPGLSALGRAQSHRIVIGNGEPVESVAENDGKTERSLRGKDPADENSDEDDSDSDSDDDSDSDTDDDDSDGEGEKDGAGDGAGDGDGNGDEGGDDVGQGEGGGGGDGEGHGGGGDGGGHGGEGGNGGEGDGEEEAGNKSDETEAKKWNLRPRKPVNRAWDPEYNGRVGVGGGGGGGGSRSAPRPAASRPRPAPRRPRAAQRKAAGVPPPAVEEKPGFSLTLTKEEIEEDFLKMTGALPPKKPQRRPKNVQKKLDELVPGCYLTPPTREPFP